MKTAEELLKEFRNENSYKLNLAEFTEALAEHDAEIKALIDEMVEEKYKYSVENGLTALTELRAKL